jgi:hypothetical protein
MALTDTAARNRKMTLCSMRGLKSIMRERATALSATASPYHLRRKATDSGWRVGGRKKKTAPCLVATNLARLPRRYQKPRGLGRSFATSAKRTQYGAAAQVKGCFVIVAPRLRLFSGVLGRGVLRTSALRRSKKLVSHVGFRGPPSLHRAAKIGEGPGYQEKLQREALKRSSSGGVFRSKSFSACW